MSLILSSNFRLSFKINSSLIILIPVLKLPYFLNYLQKLRYYLYLIFHLTYANDGVKFFTGSIKPYLI